MLKVLKFGGSSLADAHQFAKVRAIVKSDPARRVVVVSAPGKRFSEDHKITVYGKDFDESSFDGAVREMRYYTQARHAAFSDYAKRLQREKSRQARDDNTQKPHKKRNEPER